MLAGIFFIIFRIWQLCFLIIPLGMLSSIVHNYVSHNFLAPAFVLVLFIVVVIASVWVFLTLILYGIARHNGYLIALIDLLIFGGLIGGVVVLGPVAGLSCSSPNLQSPIYLQSAYEVYQFGTFCGLLKASFAFAIIDILLFFCTIFIALWVHHNHKNDRKNRGSSERRRHRSSSRRRESSRNGSRNRRDYYDDGRGRSQSRSRDGGYR